MMRSMEAAHRLLQSAEKDAFDLTREAQGFFCTQVWRHPVWTAAVLLARRLGRKRGPLCRGNHGICTLPALGILMKMVTPPLPA